MYYALNLKRGPRRLNCFRDLDDGVTSFAQITRGSGRQEF